MWLEEELKTYKTILVIVSHSQDVMNGVLHLDNRKLEVYGDYDTFMKTRLEQIRRMMKVRSISCRCMRG